MTGETVCYLIKEFIIRMLQFFDLHTHLLCGVDDGAKTPEEMYAMLDMAYEDGTRAMCLTPHYSPYLFGDTSKTSEESFHLLKAYAAERYPDMHLYLGHELGYHSSCIQALNDGVCRTLGKSRYLLVDFPEAVNFFEIQNAMSLLQRMGYHPILAHTERYRCLSSHLGWVRDFVDCGGIVQINASSVCGTWGTRAKRQWIRLVKEGLAHIISSDGHNLTSRQPKMSVCIPYLQKYCDARTIRALTWNNACRVIRDEPF